MSPDAAAKDEPPPSASRKSAAARQQEPALRCPRCDSPNTKFCYYNNYSLTQPRHFCKTCRRYWTKGGALRSVPIGGGCRKNKKMRSSPPLSADSNGSSSDLAAGLKFFQGVAPAMDFQLNFPGLYPHPAPTTALLNQFSGFVDSANTSAAIPSNPCYSLDLSATTSPLMGFNLPNSNQEIGFRSILASSIESLSSINQDLHWKLQKQRLAALLPGENQKTGCDSAKPQPILFQDLEIPSKEESCGIRTPRKDGGGNLSTEWFFDSSSYATAAAAATSINGMNGENGAGGWSNGVQPWSDISQYSSIP